MFPCSFLSSQLCWVSAQTTTEAFSLLAFNQAWAPRLLLLILPQLTSPSPQVVDVAPELLRICSLILADSRIPPGECDSHS